METYYWRHGGKWSLGLVGISCALFKQVRMVYINTIVTAFSHPGNKTTSTSVPLGGFHDDYAYSFHSKYPFIVLPVIKTIPLIPPLDFGKGFLQSALILLECQSYASSAELSAEELQN